MTAEPIPGRYASHLTRNGDRCWDDYACDL